jgi:stage II sporulation SpoAA-like protein
MENRIRFISHADKQILLIDLSNLPAAEVKRISELVPKFVTAHPKGSVLLLADFTGAEFDRETFATMKRAAVFDRPHIKKSAWVGTENLPKIFYEHLKVFSQRELPTFNTREEALDWLVKE